MTGELGLPVLAAGSVRDCLDGADLGYSATTSRGAVVIGSGDLEGLRMLATIGSTNPQQREVAGDVFGAADDFVLDTHDALTASGDLVEAAASASLPEVTLLGDFLGRAPRDGFVIYKSIGGAEQDLILAYDVLTRARERGMGTIAEAPASIVGGPPEAAQQKQEASP
jgi:ornithine cyclodeaminase/alanine dehydrogenase-like protein (mu-crystallin family)